MLVIKIRTGVSKSTISSFDSSELVHGRPLLEECKHFPTALRKLIQTLQHCQFQAYYRHAGEQGWSTDGS